MVSCDTAFNVSRPHEQWVGVVSSTNVLILQVLKVRISCSRALLGKNGSGFYIYSLLHGRHRGLGSGPTSSKQKQSSSDNILTFSRG